MGLRSREEFLKSLRDGREVYFEGNRVEGVTSHQALRVGVENAAFDYEFAEDAQYRKVAVVREKETSVQGPISGG